MSEMNRDQALLCVRKAKQFIAAGKKDKAIKFLNKSIRMYETSEAKSLLASLTNPPSNNNNSDNNTDTDTNTNSQPSRSHSQPDLQRNSASSASTSSLGGSSRMSRDEEVAMVRKILRAKDFYSILGVPHDVDEKTLKKAYRKLALKCHPDRNHSPGAEEAFKKLSKAYDCLRDKRKRQIYDQYGEDSPQMRRNTHGAQFQQMTPDDIIRMFFGGDFGGGSGFSSSGFHFHTSGFPQRRNRGGGGGNGHGGGGGTAAGGPMVYIMQLLPIILVFFTMILPSLMMFGGNSNSSSVYNSSNLEGVYFSLDRNHPFTLERKTGLDTVYYLSKSRINDWRYKTSKHTLESQVESSYLTKLINECNEQIKKDEEKLVQIRSNSINHKQRQKLIKNLIKNKESFDKYDNKKCKKLNEYLTLL